jgi:hypothetical protein
MGQYVSLMKSCCCGCPRAAPLYPADVEWKSLEDIYYPAPLSERELCAEFVNPEGMAKMSKIYNPPLGVVLKPGTYTLRLTIKNESITSNSNEVIVVSNTLHVRKGLPTINYVGVNPAPHPDHTVDDYGDCSDPWVRAFTDHEINWSNLLCEASTPQTAGAISGSWLLVCGVLAAVCESEQGPSLLATAFGDDDPVFPDKFSSEYWRMHIAYPSPQLSDIPNVIFDATAVGIHDIHVFFKPTESNLYRDSYFLLRIDVVEAPRLLWRIEGQISETDTLELGYGSALHAHMFECVLSEGLCDIQYSFDGTVEGILADGTLLESPDPTPRVMCTGEQQLVHSPSSPSLESELDLITSDTLTSPPPKSSRTIPTMDIEGALDFPLEGVLLTVGTHRIIAQCIDQDGVTYQSTLTVVVLLAKPVLEWRSIRIYPGSILNEPYHFQCTVCPNPLVNSHVNISLDQMQGAFEYTPMPGTLVEGNIGEYIEMSITFDPSENIAHKYRSVKFINKIRISAPPVLMWSKANMKYFHKYSYPRPLGKRQLCAHLQESIDEGNRSGDKSSNIIQQEATFRGDSPGKFVPLPVEFDGRVEYSHSDGTVLDAGIHTLTAFFIPTNHLAIGSISIEATRTIEGMLYQS